MKYTYNGGTDSTVDGNMTMRNIYKEFADLQDGLLYISYYFKEPLIECKIFVFHDTSSLLSRLCLVLAQYIRSFASNGVVLVWGYAGFF